MAATIACGLWPISTCAEEANPFSIDNSRWMSFDHYKENARLGKPVPSSTATDATNSATTADKDPSSLPKKDAAAAASPQAAAPTRPLNLPVMPGLNKGYNVQVDSTADDKNRSTAQILNFDTEPKMEVPKTDWQSINEISFPQARPSVVNSEGDLPLSFKVRMSFLPNPDIKPVFQKQKPSSHADAFAALAEKKKSTEEVAACAAVSSYKKKQLQALESDRKTLAALQEAIAQLGLQKQLSFMTGSNGTVDAEARMNVPAPSSGDKP